MSDAAGLSLVEILELLARRTLSARELLLDCVRRIEAGEDTIQAFVTRTPELALQAAAEADEARARGDSVGLLGGVPVAVKDVFLTRGVRTTAGSRVLAEAQRLRRVWVAKWRRLMAGHGLAAVAHPTLDAPPPLIESSRPPKGPSIRPSVPWTIAGFPALSVPAGLDDRGLPVGLSLAGLPEREAEVVGLGVVIDEEVQLWRREPKISP